MRIRFAALAVAVGAAAACGAIAFRQLIRIFGLVLSGHADYSGAGHAADPHLPWLGRWFVLAVPVLAGLIYGPLVQRLAPGQAGGLGVPEVMDAVARHGGRIEPREPAVKVAASALCLGGGGSLGREGPAVQIGAALGSSAGRLARMPEASLRVLVACGAAGALAATFNAPLAGVLFVIELILREVSAEAFCYMALSTVTATVIGQAVYGSAPILHVPESAAPAAAAYPMFVLLGALAGVVAVAFTRVLYLVQDVCDHVWRGPEWARPAVGGVLLGGLLLFRPELYGVGYAVVENTVAGRYAAAFVLALLVGKIAAAALTIGIGGYGGIFTPSLFIGAALGAAFGTLTQHAALAQGAPASEYSLVAMAALFAAAARAPLTAAVVVPEITGRYSLLLPATAAAAVATLVAGTLFRDSIYTLKLTRRGSSPDAGHG